MRARPAAIALLATGAVALAAGAARAAGPVRGTIAGPVTAVHGRSFTLRSSLSPTGTSSVQVGSSTRITKQVRASRAELRQGACVLATGRKDARGVVHADRVTISAPVAGRCRGGFARRGSGGPPAQGAQRPPRFRAQGTLGFAAGTIVSAAGSALTVRGRRGSTKVAISTRTQIVRTARVTLSALEIGLCAFVLGTSSDRGVHVTAQTVDVFKPGANGCVGRTRPR